MCAIRKNIIKDESTAQKLISNIKINDKMLRLFSECFKYLVEIENNYTATSELYKFKMGSEMNKLVDDFKKRHDIEEMTQVDSCKYICIIIHYIQKFKIKYLKT